MLTINQSSLWIPKVDIFLYTSACHGFTNKIKEFGSPPVRTQAKYGNGCSCPEALYPDLSYTSQAVNSARVFNRLVSGLLSSVSQIVKLGFSVLFNPLLEFGYVDLLEGQLSFLRYLLYLQWRSVQHSGLAVDFIVPGGFNPFLLPDISTLPQIGSSCYYTVSVRSTCYEVWAVCANGRVVGYSYSPLMEDVNFWHP